MSAPLPPLAGIREEHRADWQAALRARLASMNTTFTVDSALRVALTLDSEQAAKAYADVIADHIKVGDMHPAESDWDEWSWFLYLELKKPRRPSDPTGLMIVITPFLQVVLHRLGEHGVLIGNQPDEWHGKRR
jgi:hypothetical protein